MAKKLLKRFFRLRLVFILCVIIKFMSWKVCESNHLNVDRVDYEANKQLKKVESVSVISSVATINNGKMKPEKVASKQKQVMLPSKINPALTGHSTTLEDVTITIKTSQKFHENRIPLILQTWVKRVLNQVYVITDGDSSEVKEKLAENHFVVTNCNKSHSRVDLCCKTSNEFNVYKQTNRKWWCHIDDDAYLNVEALLQLLSKFNPDSEKIYIGRRSMNITVTRRCSYGSKKRFIYFNGGTYCTSRLLAKSMMRFFEGDSFMKMCDNCHLPEDIAVAFISSLSNATLVQSFLFHHAYELQTPLSQKNTNLKEQIVHIPGRKYSIDFSNFTRAFNKKLDPGGFLSLHCILYPNDKICPKK